MVKCPHCESVPKNKLDLALHIRREHSIDVLEAYDIYCMIKNKMNAPKEEDNGI